MYPLMNNNNQKSSIFFNVRTLDLQAAASGGAPTTPTHKRNGTRRGSAASAASANDIMMIKPPERGEQPVTIVDTESERRRLLCKLQTSSMRNIGRTAGGIFIDRDDNGGDDYSENSKSVHSSRSVRTWLWRTARTTTTRTTATTKMRKSSSKTKNKKTTSTSLLRMFHWRQKEKRSFRTSSSYNHMGRSRLTEFFETGGNDNLSAASDPIGNKKSSRHPNHNRGSKSVGDTAHGRPSLRKHLLATKQHGGTTQNHETLLSRDEEFSVEITHSVTTTKPRPMLHRQGSSLIRRLFPKQNSQKNNFLYVTPEDDDCWSASYLHDLTPTTDRLTPITVATTSDLGDVEQIDFSSKFEYGRNSNSNNNDEVDDDDEEDDVEEEWEEEPFETVHESDDDEEDITKHFRPIDPHHDPHHIRMNVTDRWSPSPSPSMDAEGAPKLPVRRSLKHNDDAGDCSSSKYYSEGGSIPVLPTRKIISRKDDHVICPIPSPARPRLKANWSDDSSVISILSGLVTHWAACGGKNDCGAVSGQKGILKKKRSSMSPVRTSPIRTKPNRSVSFDSILIREYERVLGDNPACGTGPPISIGWSYTTKASTPLDVYECIKPRPRTKRELHLPAARRKDLLVYEWGIPEEELVRARREADYIQFCRSSTIGKSTTSSRRVVARKPTPDDSDTSQPCLRRETAERAARYSPTPEIMRMMQTESLSHGSF